MAETRFKVSVAFNIAFLIIFIYSFLSGVYTNDNTIYKNKINELNTEISTVEKNNIRLIRDKVIYQKELKRLQTSIDSISTKITKGNNNIKTNETKINDIMYGRRTIQPDSVTYYVTDYLDWYRGKRGTDSDN